MRNVEAIGHVHGFRHPDGTGRGCPQGRRRFVAAQLPWGFFTTKDAQSGSNCADTVRDAASRCARSPEQLPALRRRRAGGAAQRGLAAGPTDRAAFVVSSLLILVLLVMLLVRRGMPPKTFVVGSALYMTSVSYLMIVGQRHGQRARDPALRAGRRRRPLRQALGDGRLRRLPPGRPPGGDPRHVPVLAGHDDPGAPAAPHGRHRRHALHRHSPPARPARRVECPDSPAAPAGRGAQRRRP